MLSTNLNTVLAVATLLPFALAKTFAQEQEIAEAFGLTVEQLYFHRRVTLAHGCMMAFVFTIAYPLGACSIRLWRSRTGVWCHAAWQCFAYLVMLTGFGLGTWLAWAQKMLVYKVPHAIPGMVIVGILFFMPALGYTHHGMYKKTGKRGFLTYFHMYCGRLMITLGAIDGGFGIRMRRMLPGWSAAAYGSIAGFFYLTWFIVIVVTGTKKRMARNEERKRGKASDASSVLSDPANTEHNEVASGMKQYYEKDVEKEAEAESQTA